MLRVVVRVAVGVSVEVSVGDVDGVTLSVGVLNPVAVWLSERERVRVIVFVVVGSFVGVWPDRL